MDVDVFRAMFLLYCVTFSVRALFAFEASAGQTIRDFPHPFGYAFIVVLLVTSLLSLLGIARRRTWHGVLLERAGQAGVGGLFITYGVWAWSLFGTRSYAFSWLLIFLGLGSILRVVQIEMIRRRGAKRGTP